MHAQVFHPVWIEHFFHTKIAPSVHTKIPLFGSHKKQTWHLRSKRLNGINFIFFHLGSVSTFDNWNRLPCMNLIRPNGMPIQIPYALNRICLPIQLNLIGLHNLLDGLSYIAQSNVNSSCTNSRISSFLYCFEQWVIAWVERNSPSAIDDPTINLSAKVDLHHIIILKNSIVARIGRVVGRNVVQRTPGREADATIEPILANQLSILIFKFLTHIRQLNTWFDEGLCI
mmetsp:Transcript_49349/g.148590  ORF Transcript_49349/g.148590 Transcript_49349/m.148590 type:complete len:228 (+) Transcript_49349:521-1204(+)